MSQPEIVRLSQQIGGRYDELGNLASLSSIENIRSNNVQYPKPEQKATQILIMINRKSNFSRNELAAHLKEMSLEDVADDVLHGRLR